MREIQEAALVGLGAIGAVVAPALLNVLGEERFYVVAAGARKARLEAGTRINGACCRFPVREPSAATRADLVVFAVKNTQLEGAMEDAAGAVGEGTVILPLLNGIVSEELLRARFPQAHVLTAVVRVPSTNLNGEIAWPVGRERISLGEERNDTLTPEVRAVLDLLGRGGLRCDVPADMVRDQWVKFMANVSENQVAAVMGATYGDIQKSQHLQELCRMVAREVIAVARRAGVDLTEADQEAREDYLMTLRPEGKPSTLQDVEAGRRTEVDFFGGTVVALGERYGVETPYNKFLYHAIHALEERAGGKA